LNDDNVYPATRKDSEIPKVEFKSSQTPHPSFWGSHISREPKPSLIDLKNDLKSLGEKAMMWLKGLVS
jgi:hypothetical protein